MSKPVIQVKIEGPEASGKTILAQTIASMMRIDMAYQSKCPADPLSPSDSFQLEDEFHIIQIRTKRTQE